MTGMRHGRGRLEYAAIKKTADALFEQGHSYRSAHRLLFEQEKISMSYDTFRRFASGEASLSIMVRRAKKQATVQHRQSVQENTPALLPEPPVLPAVPSAHKSTGASCARVISAVSSSEAFNADTEFDIDNLLHGTTPCEDSKE